MNIKHIFLGVCLLTTVRSQASTVAITRPFAAGQGVMAITSAGTFLTEGGYYIGIGTFASGAPVITDYASLLQAIATTYTEFGAITSATTGVNKGFVAGSVTNSNAAAFNSAEIYLVIGNAATRALSTEFAILRHTAAVSWGSNASAAGTVTFAMLTQDSFAPVPNAGTEFNDLTVANRDGIVLVGAPVPEPSGMVLLLLGLCAGMRRRR